jgi:hypothetical protein
MTTLFWQRLSCARCVNVIVVGAGRSPAPRLRKARNRAHMMAGPAPFGGTGGNRSPNRHVPAVLA